MNRNPAAGVRAGHQTAMVHPRVGRVEPLPVSDLAPDDRPPNVPDAGDGRQAGDLRKRTGPRGQLRFAALRSALRKSWRRTRCSKHPWAAGNSFCGPIQFRPASLSGLRPLEFQDFACMATTAEFTRQNSAPPHSWMAPVRTFNTFVDQARTTAKAVDWAAGRAAPSFLLTFLLTMLHV
jgi:hypothetical protein